MGSAAVVPWPDDARVAPMPRRGYHTPWGAGSRVRGKEHVGLLEPGEHTGEVRDDRTGREGVEALADGPGGGVVLLEESDEAVADGRGHGPVGQRPGALGERGRDPVEDRGVGAAGRVGWRVDRRPLPLGPPPPPPPPPPPEERALRAGREGAAHVLGAVAAAALEGGDAGWVRASRGAGRNRRSRGRRPRRIRRASALGRGRRAGAGEAAGNLLGEARRIARRVEGLAGDDPGGLVLAVPVGVACRRRSGTTMSGRNARITATTSARTSRAGQWVKASSARLREAVVVGAGEELAAAVEPTGGEEFLGADQADRLLELRPDTVLSALAAGQREVGDVGALAEGEGARTEVFSSSGCAAIMRTRGVGAQPAQRSPSAAAPSYSVPGDQAGAGAEGAWAVSGCGARIASAAAKRAARGRSLRVKELVVFMGVKVGGWGCEGHPTGPPFRSPGLARTDFGVSRSGNMVGSPGSRGPGRPSRSTLDRSRFGVVALGLGTHYPRSAASGVWRRCGAA